MRGYLVLTASGFCALCCPAHAVTPRPVQVPVSTEWLVRHYMPARVGQLSTDSIAGSAMTEAGARV